MNSPDHPVPSQGPRVFLDYDQTALDAAYNQAVYAPHAGNVRKRFLLESEAVRARIGQPLRVAYGPTGIEKVDIYKTSTINAPIFMFIHGGAWHRGSAKGNAFAAEMFVNAGVHFIVPDFTHVLEAADSLRTMVDQVRRAVVWVYKNAATFGGDAERIYLCGHSSGAHLAGCTLTTDWPAYGAPMNIIKAGLCCSGMYELYPVSLSARREYVKFDAAMIEQLSAIRHIDKIAAPLTLAYGTLETPEFQRQTPEFFAAVQKAGKPVKLIVGQEYNHHEIKETLANPYGLLGSAALEMMGIALGPL
ncbi:MAG TPA: alpha/beta hydrolase [Burkholderiales bacterium]|nr:alpha/beta hydrolase [Burkholderiales bacterium]